MKTKIKKLATLITSFSIMILTLLLGSCSSLQVAADYDKEIDFNQHKTISFYGWAAKSDSILNRFDKERIENAAKVEFEKRGYTIVENDADLVVSLFIIVDEKTSRSAYTNHYGMGGYYGYYGYGYGVRNSTTTIQDYDYKEGTIVVDVFDAETKQLIWQGIGTDVIDESPQRRDRQIPWMMSRIMQKYPLKVN